MPEVPKNGLAVKGLIGLSLPTFAQWDYFAQPPGTEVHNFYKR